MNTTEHRRGSLPAIGEKYRAGSLPAGSVVRTTTKAEYVVGRTGLCMKWEQPIPLSDQWIVEYVGRLDEGDWMTPRERAEVDEANAAAAARKPPKIGLDSAGVEYEGPRFVLDDSIYYAIKSDLEGWEKPAWCVLDQFDGGYIAFTTDEAAGERIVAALMKGEES